MKSENKLIQSVQNQFCMVLKGQAAFEVPTNSNSIVRYTKLNITPEVLKAAAPVFTKVFKKDSSIVRAYPYLKNKKVSSHDLVNMGCNFVQVFGAAPEPNHIHASTIIIQVVQGRGILWYEKDGKNLKASVEEGDMAVIPVGAPHFFHGDPLVVYAGIEFGPVIDYQKHHYHENVSKNKIPLRIR